MGKNLEKLKGRIKLTIETKHRDEGRAHLPVGNHGQLPQLWRQELDCAFARDIYSASERKGNFTG
jgi:hypothetical protein